MTTALTDRFDGVEPVTSPRNPPPAAVWGWGWLGDWAATRLGPHRQREVGRHTGARCSPPPDPPAPPPGAVPPLRGPDSPPPGAPDPGAAGQRP
jgi:hypothetical protein